MELFTVLLDNNLVILLIFSCNNEDKSVYSLDLTSTSL